MGIQTAHHEAAVPAAMFGTTYMSFISNLPPDIVMGAFTGAVVFLLGAKDKPKWMWLIFFLVAFMVGVLGADSVAGILSGSLAIIAIPVTVPNGFGALLSAACAINFISWIRDNPVFFLKQKGDKQ